MFDVTVFVRRQVYHYTMSAGDAFALKEQCAADGRPFTMTPAVQPASKAQRAA